MALVGTAVTCNGGDVTGNVGVYPGSAVTQTGCPVTGTLNPGDTAAAQGQADFAIAYAALKALACDQTLTIFDALTLAPGVYCFNAAAVSIGGVLTLDGPSDGIWIFKIGSVGTGAPHRNELLGVHVRRRTGKQCLLAHRGRRDHDRFDRPGNDPRGGGHHPDPWILQRACPDEPGR